MTAVENEPRIPHVCPLNVVACRQPGPLAPVISTRTGQQGGQCPGCLRVWYVTAGNPVDALPAGQVTWAWPTGEGGWLPASDRAASGWRRTVRNWRQDVRVRRSLWLRRWTPQCGERLPRPWRRPW
jgi:hypothetical protein